MDTLSTNARPEFGLQINGVTFRDSLLVRRMIDIVQSKDMNWKKACYLLDYGGQFHYTTESHYNIRFVEENFPDDIYPE